MKTMFSVGYAFAAVLYSGVVVEWAVIFHKAGVLPVPRAAALAVVAVTLPAAVWFGMERRRALAASMGRHPAGKGLRPTLPSQRGGAA